jgi:hypothetical protein
MGQPKVCGFAQIPAQGKMFGRVSPSLAFSRPSSNIFVQAWFSTILVRILDFSRCSPHGWLVPQGMSYPSKLIRKLPRAFGAFGRIFT